MGLRQSLMLHGLQHRRVLQEKSGAFQRLFPLLLQSLRGDAPLRRQNLVPGGEIQHACRLDLFSEKFRPFLLQGKEVQQHLNIQSHADVGQIEFLLAGFVVHHPEVQLIVLDPAVHPIHLAAYPQFTVRTGNGDGGQCSVLPSEPQFEGHGDKIRVAQFLRHLVNDSVGVGPQTVEQIPEPGGTVLEIVQLLFRVLVDILSGQAVKFFVIHCGKAALSQHIPGDIFQQIVEKRADLGRVEGGRFPGLGPQAVLHEVGEVAGAHPFQPGGGHGNPLSVNGPDCGGRQTAPSGRGGPLHGA